MAETYKNLIVVEQPKKLVVQEEKKVITFVAQQGLAGPPGPKGDIGPIGPQGEIGPQGPPGDADRFVVAEDVEFGNVLYFKEDGLLYKASSDAIDIFNNFFPVFLIAQETKTSNELTLCRYMGVLTFPTPTLIPGATYYLGLSGAITHVPPTSGVLLVVGQALTNTKLVINFREPILLRGED